MFKAGSLLTMALLEVLLPFWRDVVRYSKIGESSMTDIRMVLRNFSRFFEMTFKLAK
jgi:hypothetical protein